MHESLARSVGSLLGIAVVCIIVGESSAADPPALNPFGTVRQDRDDALPGYLEMSDGTVRPGDVYMTRDKRLKLYDETTKRQREIPLRVVKQIECKVVREWMEKEWRFKEMGGDEKFFTGKTYPAREYEYTVTLKDDRTITGPLAEILYVQPQTYKPEDPLAYRPNVQPERFLLHKRDKGEIGEKLEEVTYVKVIKLGEEALEEGRELAKERAKKKPEKAKPEDATS